MSISKTLGSRRHGVPDEFEVASPRQVPLRYYNMTVIDCKLNENTILFSSVLVTFAVVISDSADRCLDWSSPRHRHGAAIGSSREYLLALAAGGRGGWPKYSSFFKQSVDL
jgi:hypothetical protein